MAGFRALRAGAVAFLIVLAGCPATGGAPSTDTPSGVTTTVSTPPTTATTTAPRSTTTTAYCAVPRGSYTYVSLSQVNGSYVQRWSGTLDVVAAENLAAEKREAVVEGAETGCRIPTYAFESRGEYPDIVRTSGSYYWLLVGKVVVTEESSGR